MRTVDGAACIHLLGVPWLECADGGLGLQYRKGWALLAYLALQRARPHRRARLADLLWPALPERAGLTNLRQVLADLNRTLARAFGASVLCCDRETVRLCPSRGQPLFDIDLLDAPAATGGVLRALLDGTLAGGELLEGICLDGCEEFGQWLGAAREHGLQRMGGFLERMRDGLAGQGAAAEAIPVARQLTVLDPWNERHHRALMRVLALAGEHGQALAAFDRLERELRRELDVAPEPETQAMRAGIRASQHACELAIQMPAEDGQQARAAVPPARAEADGVSSSDGVCGAPVRKRTRAAVALSAAGR